MDELLAAIRKLGWDYSNNKPGRHVMLDSLASSITTDELKYLLVGISPACLKNALTQLIKEGR